MTHGTWSPASVVSCQGGVVPGDRTGELDRLGASRFAQRTAASSYQADGGSAWRHLSVALTVRGSDMSAWHWERPLTHCTCYWYRGGELFPIGPLVCFTAVNTWNSARFGLVKRTTCFDRLCGVAGSSDLDYHWFGKYCQQGKRVHILGDENPTAAENVYGKLPLPWQNCPEIPQYSSFWLDKMLIFLGESNLNLSAAGKYQLITHTHMHARTHTHTHTRKTITTKLSIFVRDNKQVHVWPIGQSPIGPRYTSFVVK